MKITLGDTRDSHVMNELINSLEESQFWEANRSSDRQEFPYILWKPKAH
jgi:hypothetical protein